MVCFTSPFRDYYTGGNISTTYGNRFPMNRVVISMGYEVLKDRSGLESITPGITGPNHAADELADITDQMCPTWFRSARMPRLGKSPLHIPHVRCNNSPISE